MRWRSSGPGRGGERSDAAPHPEWPAVGTPVLLVAATGDGASPGTDGGAALAAGGGQGTRVEDATAHALALAEPRSALVDLEPPADGAPFELRWTAERGVRVLPVELLRRERGAGVPLWWFAPTDAVSSEQRRAHVRAAAAGAGWPVRVELRWVLPEEGSAEGDLLDLSEGGLRARLRGLACPEGGSVAVRLTVAEADRGAAGVDVVEHDLVGTLLRAGDALGAAPGTTEVVVQLHDTGAGDDLRRLVFAWERRARRA